MDKFIYLHGFASGPGSKKAMLFRREFEKRGLPLEIPDLEGGDFENLTISRQIDIVQQCLDSKTGKRFGLIGSSMGGYLAVLLAQLRTEVDSVYLMAPAFNFFNRWWSRLNLDFSDKPDIPGLIEVFHYRYNEKRKLNTYLLEDARKWEALSLDRIIPTRIVHGLRDESVAIDESRGFVATHPWCGLVELDSDHSLLSHADWIVADCLRFFNTV